MKDIIGKCKIYIIESQSDNDIFDGRTEGNALSSGLKLAGISNEYYQVINEKMLDKAILKISENIKELVSNGKLIVPFIHFSAHGNESGIGLTNNDFIDWSKLRKKIDYANSIIGKVKFDDSDNAREFSRLNLSFSVCKGINAIKIQQGFEDNKYLQLVGPNVAVDWADSLIAFMTFYHLMFYKSEVITAFEIVEKMNIAAGLKDIFEISGGSGLVRRE
ncbi:hypothetical protein [Winogradskyella ludwigii]|uniref:hypothetical protein n=1 Tax=Winogradskyella ludwigii TaxID=2686076 RepID=UPI0015CA3562|nr:hypothetical protein [Winogradskyella ludwigii]